MRREAFNVMSNQKLYALSPVDGGEGLGRGDGASRLTPHASREQRGYLSRLPPPAFHSAPEPRASAISVGAHWPLWILALLPLLWWASVRTRSSLSRRHFAVATVLRSGALVSIVLALSAAGSPCGGGRRSRRAHALAPVAQCRERFRVVGACPRAAGQSRGLAVAVRYVVFAEQARDGCVPRRTSPRSQSAVRPGPIALGVHHAGRHQPRARPRPVAAQGRPGDR